MRVILQIQKKTLSENCCRNFVEICHIISPKFWQKGTLHVLQMVFSTNRPGTVAPRYAAAGAQANKDLQAHLEARGEGRLRLLPRLAEYGASARTSSAPARPIDPIGRAFFVVASERKDYFEVVPKRRVLKWVNVKYDSKKAESQKPKIMLWRDQKQAHSGHSSACGSATLSTAPPRDF